MANEPVESTTPDVTPVEDTAATNETLIGDPKASTTPVEPKIEAPVKRKMKWGDTEKEVTFDEAVQLAQKAWGIESKAKEAHEKAESADKLLSMLQDDPKAFAKRARAMGLNPEKLATEILYDQIQRNSMTPEQRELMEYKEKEAERVAEEKAAADLKRAQEVDTKTKEWSANFEKQLEGALKTQGLPKTRLALALTAQYIDAGLAQKKDYTVEQVLPYVLRDLKQIHLETMGQLDGDDLLAYIGDDMANKVSQARVNKFKKAPPVADVPQVPKKIDDKLKNLKGKAYWAHLRRTKSEQGIEAFPGAE